MSALPKPLDFYPLSRMHPAAQRDQWRWRRRYTDGLRNERIANELHARATILDETNYRQANVLTRTLATALKQANIHRAFDEQTIRDFAENRARMCAQLRTIEQRSGFAEYCGIAPPQGRTITVEGALKRLIDPLWWRRQIRKCWTREAENGERQLGIVRRDREPYASDDAVRRRGAQKRRMRDWLQNHQVSSDDGDTLALDILADHSLSNPALRRGELMVRARGFEEIAQRLGHSAVFFTLTTPSHFHAQLANGGANPGYSSATVRDAQIWLCRMWARARAKVQRAGILCYGFRVAEPHHDGTPHWHVLLFVRARELDVLRSIITAQFLSEFGDDPGAREHRVGCEAIDSSKGSATGYLAKYVSKNIDGAGAIANERSDEDSGRRISGQGGTVERVDAWASTHGVRQFAQIGGPPVSLYREARRLRDPAEDPDIERARLLADSGRCGGFIDSIGGIAAGRNTNLRLERCESGRRSRYGEPRPAEIIGLRWASAVVITRPCQWRIERKPCSSAPLLSALGPVAISVRGGAAAPGYNEPAGWTNPNETSQAGPF
jgi:hypothetical protein